MNDIKTDLTKELKLLLAEWTSLSTHQGATQRDYARIKAKIETICNVLDSFDGKDNV